MTHFHNHQPNPDWNMTSTSRIGFFGPPTSTVDWCEANYEITFYIAEFFNTISSLTMILCGLWGAVMHGWLGKRFISVFSCFTVVGIGSAAFHGTLLFPLQILDELPMCYTALALAYCQIESEKQKRHGRWLPTVFVLWGVIVSYMVAGHGGNLQFFFFHFNYDLIQVFVFIGIFKYVRNSKNPAALSTFYQSLILYSIAIVLWMIDLNFCSLMESLPLNPQFHSFWHLFAGTGCYLSCMLVVLHRTEVCDIPADVAWYWGFLPYVKELKGEEANQFMMMLKSGALLLKAKKNL